MTRNVTPKIETASPNVSCGYIPTGDIVDNDTTPIHKFAYTYDIPHKIANLLIGKTEEETEENISLLSMSINRFVDKEIDIIINSKDQSIKDSRSPYGWGKICNRFVQIPEEQNVINIMVSMYKDGNNMSNIKKYLDANGYKPRHNADTGWQTNVIYKIIKRETSRAENTRKKR